MVKLVRIASAGFILLSILIMFALPVYAIAPADTLTIHSVTAYYSLYETDDQLYLIDCTIDYGANPTESGTEAYLARLMDGTDELGSQAPYAYYDEGYDREAIAIYFSPDDAPVWAGDYTLRLEGNPTLSWVPSRPVTSTSGIVFSIGADQRASLASKILWLADQYEVEWSVDLITTYASGSRLTEYGEAYFSSVIPYLFVMCPTIFEGGSSNPDVVDRDNNRAAATELTARTAGTVFDLTDPADAFGVSAGTLGISICALCILVAAGFFAKSIPEASSVIILLVIPIVILCRLAGWLPFVIEIGLDALALALSWYVFTLEKSAT